MPVSGATRLRSSACFTGLTLIGLLFCLSVCTGQAWESGDRDIGGIIKGVNRFRSFFIELAKAVTGSGIYSKQQQRLSVRERSETEMKDLLGETEGDMKEILDRKRAAVEKLKEAAEEGGVEYGRYKPEITFEDVSYFNAKKVVIDNDMHSMSKKYQSTIKATINYLKTQPAWNFKENSSRPQLNPNTSTIHVPTNIYDKSMKILNGVQWTDKMTGQFVRNSKKDPSLTWQYFCSSDGFFRIYPGMQWPRDADQVDTFDCRMRQWYIQAASSPKNIIILLDSSGSMKGLRYSIARSTVSTILDTLSNEDYFNVIQFSDEPQYVDECFNGTLMPASVENIKRAQDKIEGLKAQKYANFEKALKLAFTLFRKEEHEEHVKICNKAIMLITDGAPDNFDYIFDYYNWPYNKTVRVFSFLIGKEVPDNRQARWMACANKGKFAHISTRADVQENVQKYIKVLSRPLAIHRAEHSVWSHVYLDYVTEQGDIPVVMGLPYQLDVEYESLIPFPGLGLIMSISMPVFDNRSKDKVGPKEEDPSRNLLGVIGTDVRINELLRLIPTFKLGVNGYAFAITNHGYILFHPEYKPFHIESSSGKRTLKPRPKYNSVEFTELEQIVPSAKQKLKEHPLRKYLLNARLGSLNMTISVLTHMDNMRRATERKITYQFREVADTFRLVFVIPSAYGSLQIKPESPPSINDVLTHLSSVFSAHIQRDISPWVFCKSSDLESYVHMTWFDFQTYLLSNNRSIFRLCGPDFMENMLVDLLITSKYSQTWEGTDIDYKKSRKRPQYVKEYSECQTDYDYDRSRRQRCHFETHSLYEIQHIWIGTRTGLTVYSQTSQFVDPSWQIHNIQTIKSLYYKRAVDGWEHGFRYVVSGPTNRLQKEFGFNSSVVTVSMAEIVGPSKPLQVPAAVVAFNMNYSAFYDNFVKYAFDCQQDDDCASICSDSGYFNCYLIDNNAYILASNNPDHNGTNLSLGQHDKPLMQSLIKEKIFHGFQLTDYQSICATKILSGQDNASSFLVSPLRSIVKAFFWIFSEIVIFFSEWSFLSWHRQSGVQAKNTGDSYESSSADEQCGWWIPEQYARYIYCGFVVSETTGQRIREDYVTQMRSCERKMMRYTLDLEALKFRQSAQKPSIPDCESQCSKNLTSYHIHWLNNTNMVFIVSDANCQCSLPSRVEEKEGSADGEVDSESESEESEKEEEDKNDFNFIPKEVLYNEKMQCQRLRNLSQELKRFDKTRTPKTLCLDSSNEEDIPCASSWILMPSSLVCVLTFLLSVLKHHLLL